MAYIENSDRSIIHLKQSHLFGRLLNVVDTYLKDSTVSRLHFLMEYTAPNWYLVDYSSNGTWVNGVRITKGVQTLVKQEDVIIVGGKFGTEFQFVDAGEPVDILCRRNSADSPIIETLQLQSTNHLPNQQHCEMSITRENDNWVLEHQHKQRSLQDGDWVTIEKQNWQLVLTDVPNSTMMIQDDNPLELSDIQLELSTSLDEETTRGRMVSHMGEVNLQARSHNYLLLLLARQRVTDANKNTDSTECGWVYMNELMAMMGMSETLINIQIYRARKQIESALNGLIDGKQLIERRSGQIRIGLKQIAIYKGDSLEEQNLVSRNVESRSLEHQAA
jgi:hypothetical protein